MVALLTVATGAVAAGGGGALTPQGCVDDNDDPQGPDTCALTADGLDAPRSVAVSPDGESVYAVGAADDAIVHFDRDPASGALTPQGCVDDNDFGIDPLQGPDTCAQSADGLNGATRSPSAPTASPSTSPRRQTMQSSASTATRPTARLTPQGCIDDGDAGEEPTAAAATAWP